MSREEAGEPRPRDAKALLSAGALLAVVAAVFVLGAVLHGRVPAPAPEPADVAAPAFSEVPTDRPAPAPQAPEDSLAARAERDAARLAEDGGAFTLQLVVACQEEGVRRLLEAGGDDGRLFVLPREVGGRPCWAVSWGTFASEAEAAAAALPPVLQLSEPPRPRPIAQDAP